MQSIFGPPLQEGSQSRDEGMSSRAAAFLRAPRPGEGAHADGDSDSPGSDSGSDVYAMSEDDPG